MKIAKRIISLILALSVFGVMSLSFTASAEASLKIGDVTFNIEDGVAYFTVPYTATDVAQVTLLACKGDSSGTPTESDENIVYVTQQDSKLGSFTFKVSMKHFTEETPYIYIKIGGTSIETAQSAPGIEVEDVVSILVYGDTTNDTNIDISDVVLLVKYISAKGAGAQLDEKEFPNGTFPGGTEDVAKLTDDDTIDISDVVILVKYISAKGAGAQLDEKDFPGGKFPGDKNN